MKNNSPNLQDILNTARSIAWGAADILRSYYRGTANDGNLEVQEDKKDGPVTAADVAANHYILDRLKQELPIADFGYLSEETHKGTEALPQEWVWIIDPLDGTRDFIDKTGEYAIHLALTRQGRPVLAVVAIPEAEKIYYAVKGGGTFVESRKGEIKAVQVSERSSLGELYLVASRTHRDERFQKLLDLMSFKARNYVGSVGCKIATILEQQSDVYISLSGKSAPKDWDFAAPELILTEAGGSFSYFNGNPVLYNQGDVKKWGGLMASNGGCHDLLCSTATRILEEIDRQG
jgi:3'(2'), 5'-bisphosphate nucleotidase